MKLPGSSRKKQTLKRKLFIYMCVLAVLLFALLIGGMTLIGNFTGTHERVAQTLSFQADVFERQIDTYYDSLALMSVQLSQTSTEILDDFLAENGISFRDINGSEKYIATLQERLIVTLRRKLWEADCTGAFIILDAQVNHDVENAATSRTGIYLQRNSLEGADTRVLLYRGISKTGKANNCMPHRKWRLEFDTTLFPNYGELKAEAEFPLWQSYRITDVVMLPGTDQHVMLMTVPLLSDDGEFFGLCGFEINEGYFKSKFAQPSELERAVFCISKNSGKVQSSQQMLSAGVLNEYYLEPSGSFTVRDFGHGLSEYVGESSSYVAIAREICLSPGKCKSELCVMIPKSDFDGMLTRDVLRIAFLIVSFSLIAVGLAMFFTKRYLKPLKQSLDRIRRKEFEQSTAYTTEICDLFAFLAEQDRISEAQLDAARRERAAALVAINEMQLRVDEVSKNVTRLAYSRRDEIDPDDYENFKNGLKSLTEKENEVLRLYIDGKSVKDIIEILGIQESTVRFHNKNIYAKLGVHSLKQLLRYSAVLRSEEEE